jgi:hypothetical protein
MCGRLAGRHELVDEKDVIVKRLSGIHREDLDGLP